MRRSGRKAPIWQTDLETRSLASMTAVARAYGASDKTIQGIHFRLMSKEERRKAAKHGWLNWHMNRRRLPLDADDKQIKAYKRRVSWRRVH
jgi:hypothetical protein